MKVRKEGEREHRMGGESQKGIKVKQVGGGKVRGWREEQEACGGQCEVSTTDIQDETNSVCEDQAGEGGNVYSRRDRVGRNDLVWYLWA